MTFFRIPDSERTLRIALLESDQSQADLLKKWLEEASCCCKHYVYSKDFLRDLGRESFNMIITDWNLADGSGFDVLSIVRTSLDWPVPVVFVSVQNQENDIILALEHGADDYLVRPLRQREMLARLRALSRRCGIGPDHSHQHLTLGPYEIDADNNVITLNGESVALTEKEFKLATLLFQNINRALSRSHLLQSVWNLNEPIPTRTLDTHISSLRVKLNLIRETGLRLRSVYRYGYRLEQTGARPSPDKIRPAANGNTLRSEH